MVIRISCTGVFYSFDFNNKCFVWLIWGMKLSHRNVTCNIKMLFVSMVFCQMMLQCIAVRKHFLAIVAAKWFLARMYSGMNFGRIFREKSFRTEFTGKRSFTGMTVHVPFQTRTEIAYSVLSFNRTTTTTAHTILSPTIYILCSVIFATYATRHSALLMDKHMHN